jgi:hypothetical protein
MHPNPRHEVKFGVEMEFQDEVEPLISLLYDDAMIPSPRKHDYHCGCDHCLFETGYNIKVQRDSSCGGEVITRPYTFREWEEFKELTDHIQLRAVQADVKAGYDAGVHVHVTPPSTLTGKAKAFSAFYLWQDELMKLAQGKDAYVREFNQMIGQTDQVYAPGRSMFALWLNQESITVESLAEHLRTNVDIRRSFYQNHNEYADRHTTLNTNTGHHTWEYRLWNSSRAAWRLRGYVAWSVALADPAVATEMLNVTPELRKLGSIFLNHGHALAGASLNRQARWASTLERV